MATRMDIPASLVAVLYETMKKHEQWETMNYMREELGSQTVALSSDIVAAIAPVLLEHKEINVLVELYKVVDRYD